MVVNLAKQVLIPLFGKVELEKTYRALLEALGNPSFFHLKNLGVGSVKTWHGQTELRVNACVAISTPYLDEYDSADDDPPSHDVSFEGKLKIVDRANLPQLVATCVVNSFTEAGLHPKVNPVVPTLLFDSFTFKICL